MEVDEAAYMAQVTGKAKSNPYRKKWGWGWGSPFLLGTPHFKLLVVFQLPNNVTIQTHWNKCIDSLRLFSSVN